MVVMTKSTRGGAGVAHAAFPPALGHPRYRVMCLADPARIRGMVVGFEAALQRLEGSPLDVRCVPRSEREPAAQVGDALHLLATAVATEFNGAFLLDTDFAVATLRRLCCEWFVMSRSNPEVHHVHLVCRETLSALDLVLIADQLRL